MLDILSGIADTNTTIAAVSTPPGVGGIAVIRLSGPEAFEIADKIWKGKKLKEVSSHTVHFGTVLDSQGEPLDQCVASVFVAPHSFTGQNTVEFAVHGSKYIQRELLASLTAAGANLARPGEFTRRAFVNGRLQLTQAEAIADVIATDSRAAHRLALSQLKGSFASRINSLRDSLLQLVTLLELELDFSEEDVVFANREQLRQNATDIRQHIETLLRSFRTGNAIKNGIPVAIVGPTNAGKSSLLNALVEHDRAIVSDINGTTRDTVEETAEVGDYLFRFIDTAGLRSTDDPIEQLGIERSEQAAQNAHIIINLIDSSAPQQGIEYARQISENLQPHQSQLLVFNKIDLTHDMSHHPDAIHLSAKTHEGIETLRRKMIDVMDRQRYGSGNNNAATDASNDVIVTNQRHADALARAAMAATAMIDAIDADIPTDLVAQEARGVLDALGELTGQITSDEILGNIFSRFCIGK